MDVALPASPSVGLYRRLEMTDGLIMATLNETRPTQQRQAVEGSRPAAGLGLPGLAPVEPLLGQEQGHLGVRRMGAEVIRHQAPGILGATQISERFRSAGKQGPGSAEPETVRRTIGGRRDGCRSAPGSSLNRNPAVGTASRRARAVSGPRGHCRYTGPGAACAPVPGPLPGNAEGNCPRGVRRRWPPGDFTEDAGRHRLAGSAPPRYPDGTAGGFFVGYQAVGEKPLPQGLGHDLGQSGVPSGARQSRRSRIFCSVV